MKGRQSVARRGDDVFDAHDAEPQHYDDAADRRLPGPTCHCEPTRGRLIARPMAMTNVAYATSSLMIRGIARYLAAALVGVNDKRKPPSPSLTQSPSKVASGCWVRRHSHVRVSRADT